MALDGCGQLCKCFLIMFNIIFSLVGMAMFGLGLWLRFSSETRGFFNIDLNTQQFVICVSVLIALGAVILLVAVFGDYGACNENMNGLAVNSQVLLAAPLTSQGPSKRLSSISQLIRYLEPWCTLQPSRSTENLASITALVCCSILMKQIKKSRLSDPVY
ncbi:CD9 antigen-like [Oncorhynchus keta]|uniref:CD9 antigen-like n=1 Tax=Oncorhynchus keta TaxID=8018 RepID=UPI00227C9C78|nr:CD9 antigen-like [Oncorhynchus keta]